MRQYFEKMEDIGKELKPKALERTAASAKNISEVEAIFDKEVARVKASGIPAETRSAPAYWGNHGCWNQ